MDYSIRIVFVVMALALGPVGLGHAAAQNRSLEEEAIRRSVAAHDEAWNEQDAKALAELYTLDAISVVPRREFNGRTEIEKNFSEVFGWSASTRTTRIESIRFLAPDAAEVRGTYRITGRRPGMGSGRFLNVVVKQDERWLRRESLSSSSTTVPLISQRTSPVREISLETPDGRKPIGVVRVPPGQGPFPAVLLPHHGSLSESSAVGAPSVSGPALKAQALTWPTMTRFLAAGYVTVIAGFRSPDFDALTADSKQWLSQGVTDLQAMIRHVKAMPQVSPDSVAVYGCSGGGGLALGVAGEIDVAAVAGEEPNFGWYYESWMANNLAMFLQATEDPHRFFTSAVRRTAREKLRTISSPIFIAHSGYNKIISEIWLPDLKATQEEVEAVVYPGQRHCFGFYAGTSAPFADDDARAAGRKFFEDMNSFFKRHLPTQPVPLEEELVR